MQDDAPGLSGRVPFDGATPLAIATQQQAGAPPLDVDPALAAIVSRCLSVAIEDRPLHAGAVAEALRAWIDGDAAPPWPWHRVRPRSIRGDGDDPGHARGAARRQARRRSISPVAVVVGVVLLGVALAGIGLALSGGQPALGEAGASATPSATVTPDPDAELAGGAARRLPRRVRRAAGSVRAEGLRRPEAEALVAEAMQECQDEDQGGKGKGHGRSWRQRSGSPRPTTD